MIVHQEAAEYSPWTKLIFFIPIGLFIGAAVAASYGESEGTYFLIGEGVFFLVLFHFIMPRRYEIHQDRLRIVLGSPFAISIPLSTVKEAKRSSGAKAYLFAGVRFATSSRYVIEIVRSKGLNYVISPRNGDLFLEQLRQALKSLAR